MTEVAGALNFRDVGGLPAGARTTRHGVLFRSGNLARVEAAGAQRLREIGLRRIVDLREDEEIAFEPTRLEGIDAETLRVPLFTGSAASFFVEDVSLAGMYRTLITGSADRIVDVVRAVIADQPVLVHCTVGKDRTGVIVALTLAAAGVDDDAVIADYSRTEALLPARRNAAVLAHLRRHHPDARNLEDLACKSPASVMRDLLDELVAGYGGADGYLQAHGLDDDELRELRKVLLR